MQKLVSAAILALCGVPLLSSFNAAAQAPWPPPPGMSAGEYAERYGNRARPQEFTTPRSRGSGSAHQYGGPEYRQRGEAEYRERGYGREGGYRDRERDYGSRARGYSDRERDYDSRERGRGSRGREYGFDEREYLRCNPDVRQSVNRGQMQSGAAHYQTFGAREGRRLSC